MGLSAPIVYTGIRIPGFHPGESGSNPDGSAILKHIDAYKDIELIAYITVRDVCFNMVLLGYRLVGLRHWSLKSVSLVRIQLPLPTNNVRW